MRLRSKILISHAVLAATVTLICGVIIGALWLADANRRHLRFSYEQLRNVNLVAAEANRLFEQIAELFILGPGGADIADARAAFLQRLQVQRGLVTGEMENSADPEGVAGEREELMHMEAVEALVADLDLMTARLADHLAAGRRETAVALYASEIENRFDRAIGALIEGMMARERTQVQAALDRSALLSRRSTFLAFSVVAIIGTLGLGNAYLLNRTILRPIGALAAGADAVARGELDHIVAGEGRDELGDLAARFNHMTAQLRDQHDRLRRIQLGLAGEVEARTAELRARSAELEAANARLRAVDASRAQFFADISHELRTPITILRGQAEVALRRPAPSVAEQNRTLGSIVAKAAQIGRLVDDLLFLARSDEGTIGVAFKEVILQEVLGDALLDGQGLPRRNEITIRASQPEEPVVVQGDADRLRQVLLIALDNAVKLAPAGTTVEIALDRNGDQAVLKVCDEGPGFSEDEIASAFTRFHRGKAAQARSGRGMGLGLSIAKWIVDRHGGTIRIESAEGSGAVVAIALPLAEAAA